MISDTNLPAASRVRGRLLVLVFAIVWMWLPWAVSAARDLDQGVVSQAPNSSTIDFVELDGVIDPVSSRFLFRQLGGSAARGSDLVIIRLDTPGGLGISIHAIVQRILDSPVPIIVWVAPSGAQATSAGVFIAYAAHVTAMSPGASIGPAHPVNLDGAANKRATGETAAYLREISNRRGRNADWAFTAERESVALDATDAAEVDAVDLFAGSPATLLEALHGRTVNVTPNASIERDVTLRTDRYRLVFHKMSLGERLLHTAIRPEISYMLLIIGFFGLIFELYNPGIGAAGLLGGGCLVLGFYGLSVLPVSWTGAGLIVLAFLLFVIDLHRSGFGVFTLGGVASLLGGSVLLLAGAPPSLGLRWWPIAGAVVAAVLFFISVMTAAIRARTARPVPGAESLVGTLGIARSDIAPDGQVMARGTLWRARTVGMAIGQGSPVRILGVSGLMLMVEEAAESADSNNGRQG